MKPKEGDRNSETAGPQPNAGFMHFPQIHKNELDVFPAVSVVKSYATRGVCVKRAC